MNNQYSNFKNKMIKINNIFINFRILFLKLEFQIDLLKCYEQIKIWSANNYLSKSIGNIRQLFSLKTEFQLQFSNLFNQYLI